MLRRTLIIQIRGASTRIGARKQEALDCDALFSAKLGVVVSDIVGLSDPHGRTTPT
jgi:hypothetical protein